MYSYYPLEELKNDPNYISAAEILEAILNRNIPSKKTLYNIYGNLTSVIIKNLENHFERFPLENILLRKHHTDPAVITEAKKKLEKNLKYAKLHASILNDKIPVLSDLSPFYGEYSDTVQSILAIYMKHKLKRKCGIPAAAHPSRVGGLVYTLGFDNPGSHKYTAVAFLHDCIEDLLIFDKQGTGDHYGLKSMELFFDDYIPDELQPNIRLLTNHYNLILYYLNYLLTLGNASVNNNTLLKKIETLCSWDWSLKEQVKKVYDLLCSNVLEEPAIINAKWQCYNGLYIREMADNALKMSDFRTFEIKAIDLTDNAHGSAALSLPEKLRNIIKLGIWANQGYRLHLDWKPTNNYIEELFEEALVYSENIVIKDFLQPYSKQDFFVSALLKIEELKSIFYTE